MRIAIVSNSQGTAAGVERGSHYPALVRDALDTEHEVHFFVTSGWTIGDFNVHIGSLLDARPDLVVVQLGVVEAAKRILSAREKRLLRILGPPSLKLTKYLHDRRQAVIRLRNRLRIDTRLYSPDEFERQLEAFLTTVRASGADVILLEIPPFDSRYEELHYPLISDDIAAVNDVLRGYGAVPLLPPGTDTFRIWQPGTVHFTPEGHRIAAEQVVSFIREHTASTV